MSYLMSGRRILIGVLALALLAASAVGLGQAQEPGPGEQARPDITDSPAGTEGIVTRDIPIQGRLTDADGRPLPDGTYSITFRLYNAVAGNLLCEDTDTPVVTNGLFTARMGYCAASDINGQELWLGITVEDDEEMVPRQRIAPVPYARSLRPGAVISGEVSDDSVLSVRNSSTVDNSIGIYGQASGFSGETYGVYGASLSTDGYGGGFSGANGLHAVGITGVAIKAGGTGAIQSAANSYLWISGNSLQKANSDDTTRLAHDNYGGYQVYRGTDVTPIRRVVLPVTIPGQLYGQNVTVTGMDLYYAIDGEFALIDAVIVARQDGAGAGDNILFDDADLTCGQGLQCSKHWDLTQNNVLSDQRGILYIVLRLSFEDGISLVQIGGVRLTLEHD